MACMINPPKLKLAIIQYGNFVCLITVCVAMVTLFTIIIIMHYYSSLKLIMNVCPMAMGIKCNLLLYLQICAIGYETNHSLHTTVRF